MTTRKSASETNTLQFLVSELPQKKPTRFSVVPEVAALEDMRVALDLLGLRKVRFDGTLTPRGKSDWQLEAKLGATVVQPCVSTLEPVTTRLEEPVARFFSRDLSDELPEEMEMPEDDAVELLGTTIDISGILQEALALALPLYPRAKDAEIETLVFTEPGKSPMTDEDTRPFAGLAGLRDSLKKDEE